MTEEMIKKAIVAVGWRMYQKNLVVSNDGNISVKAADGVWTTPTGVCKGDLTEDMLVKVDWQGNVLKGHLKPSSELKMHLRVYQENPRVQAVVHAHPPVATSFAVAGIPLDQPILPEAIVQLDQVPVAPYAVPGSEGVAQSIVPYLQGHNALLLANHGALTWGDDLWQAYYRMESLEYYAQVTFNTLYVLKSAQYLSDEAVEASLETRRRLGFSGEDLAGES